MCKGSNTTTTSTAPNPQAMAAYQDVLNRAQGVAQTPYQPYTGDLTAPINAQQTAGISNINQNAGFAQPFIQQANQFATSAAQPLTQQQIQQYQSPYTQSVVDATSNWFNNQNQQQQQNVLGNAAAQGALGGDRVGVAQANLAAQQTASQAPVIAGLYNQGYQQAVGVAQQQQQNQANAAYSLGNLGVAGQNAALTGANAQVGAGTLQQQNEQQRLNALYQQFQIGQAFPYQQTQWLAGIDTGVGSNLGGTSQTTAPPPNPLAQYGGLGLAAASFLLKRGGAVRGFAPGGTVDDSPYAGVGWVPMRGITMGKGAPNAPNVPGVAPPIDMTKAGLAFANRAKSVNGDDQARPSMSWDSFSPTRAGVYNDIGMSPAVAGLGPIYRAGGPVRGFAPGGAPDDDLPFADRWAPTVDALRSGDFDPQGRNYTHRYEQPFADPNAVPLPRPRPDANQAVAASEDEAPAPLGFAPREGGPPQPLAGILPGEHAPAEEPLAYGAGAPTAGFTPSFAGDSNAAGVPQERRGFGLGLLPNDLRMPLLAAGLGMLASRSPNLGNAIGEGGLTGVGAYAQQKQLEQARQEKQQTFSQQNRRIELEAKRLDQAAEQARKHLDLQTQQLGETKRQHDIQERTKLIPSGFRQTDDGSLEVVPGGPQDPKTIEAQTRAKRTSDLTDNAVEIASRQLAQGDLSALTNIGRGVQGDQKLTMIKNRTAQILVDQGMTPTEAASHLSTQLQAFKARGIGLSAEERTGANREANLKIILKATEAAIPAALEASRNVARTGWVPINQIIQKGQVIASSPELKEFGMANLQLAEHWARAMNPTGVMRESDRDMALHFLSTADSQPTYERAVKQLEKQIRREKDAVASQRTPVGGTTTPEPRATPEAAPTAPTVRQNGHTYQRQPDGSYKAID